MSARMWCTALVSIGLAAALLSGCSTQQGPQALRSPDGMAAEAAYAKAVEAPDVSPREILPDTHVAAGRLHESNGRLARAAEQYRLAIGALPKHVEAYNRLGVVLDRLGKFAEADQAFARAIQLAPRQAYLHNNLAFSYTMQGRWAEAEAALNKALSLQPDFPRARVNMGMVLAQRGRFEEALSQFRQALRSEDAYYNLGLMYQSKNLPVEAAQAFRQALAANPKMVAAQKRVDMLPASAVSEAARRGDLFVPAMALTGTKPDDPASEVPAGGPADAIIAETPDTDAGTFGLPADEVITPPSDPDGEIFPQALPALEFNSPEELDWFERDLLPEMPAEVFGLMDAETDAAEAPAEPALTLESADWQRLQLLVQELKAPFERLLSWRAGHRSGTAELSSPLPVIVPEPQPGDFVGPPAFPEEP